MDLFSGLDEGDASHIGLGDLDGVEQDAGLFELEAVVGDGADDLHDGHLEGVGVFDGRKFELLGAAADVVVEVAVILAGKGRRTAADAVHLGVEALRDVGLDGHRYISPSPIWGLAESTT